MATRVSNILNDKGFTVLTVKHDDTVEAVAHVLSQNRIGAAPVLGDDGRLAGMISERDLVRGIGQHGAPALRLKISELMTRDVKTCRTDDAVVELMQVMTDRRIRHLPVLEEGSLVGLVSIGDVVKVRLAEAQSEAEALREYIAA